MKIFPKIKIKKKYNLSFLKKSFLRKEIFLSIDSHHDQNNWKESNFINLTEKLLKSKKVSKIYLNFSPNKIDAFKKILKKFYHNKKVTFTYKDKFSSIIDKINNHSNLNENDDMEWIKDIEPPSYDSLVGKALYFDPHIDTHQQLNSVLKVLKMLGFHYGVWADNFGGRLEKYKGEEIIGLYLRTDDGGITYTAYIDEDYEEHISDWAGEPVQVLDGWQTLGDFI